MFLKESELAKELNISSAFLKNDRKRECPVIPFVRIGEKSIRYDLDTVKSVLLSSSVDDLLRIGDGDMEISYIKLSSDLKSKKNLFIKKYNNGEISHDILTFNLSSIINEYDLYIRKLSEGENR